MSDLHSFRLTCRTGGDLRSIADQFFCPEERAELMSTIATQREAAFYLCWTRKEAVVKAMGDGLFASLKDFRVTLRPGQPARLVQFVQPPEAESWTLHHLELSPNYVGALAYSGAERPVTLWPTIDPVELLENSPKLAPRFTATI